jgi:endonuclease/exonuclease/phosphatase (EEP) superfamily protein YafD
MGALVVICIFPPQLIWAKKLSDLMVQVMIGFLILGLVFLLMEARNLMFASFAFCGILCLFLKDSVNQDLRLPSNTGAPSVTVAHVNLKAFGIGQDSVIKMLIQSDADVISFNEVTTDWKTYLDEKLKLIYSYDAKLVRKDRYGLAYFSKIPIKAIDTVRVYGGDRPHLQIELTMGLKRKLTIINSYFLPPLSRQAYGDYRVELTQLGQLIEKKSGAVLALGDYNLSDWSNEMREFKSLSGLISSRRDVSSGSKSGIKTLWNLPVDHILFNDEMECVRFSNLTFGEEIHIGIIGEYQLKQSQTKRKL